MQLHSKTRYISAQFQRYLTGNLWKKNAANANRMAKLLASEIDKINGLKRTQVVAANSVFAVLPSKLIAPLQQHYFFYVWNAQISEVRLMCSWDTREEDVAQFMLLLKKLRAKV